MDAQEWVTLTYRCDEGNVDADTGECSIKLNFYELTDAEAQVFTVSTDDFSIVQVADVVGGEAGIEATTNPEPNGDRRLEGEELGENEVAVSMNPKTQYVSVVFLGNNFDGTFGVSADNYVTGGESNGDGIPGWGIALLVVGGVLIVLVCALVMLLVVFILLKLKGGKSNAVKELEGGQVEYETAPNDT